MATKIIKQGATAPTAQTEDHPIARPYSLECKLLQLKALLNGCYGFGAEWFEEMGPDSRERIMWLAADLAKDAHRLHQQAMRDRAAADGIAHGGGARHG